MTDQNETSETLHVAGEQESPLQEVVSLPEETQLPADADLEAVLAAFHATTLRLEKTHEVLRDEVRRLVSELEIKNRELARKNRLADLGQVASHVAHEVRNGLVPVTLYLSLLRRRLTEDQGSIEVLDKSTAALTELDATVNDLLHFTADREPDVSTISLRSLIHDVQTLIQPQLSAQQISVVTDVPEEICISADRDMIRRAVLNLALNALDAMPEGGELVITGVDCDEAVELEVADSGRGLSDDARRRAFEPFFTTKSSGTGLGLAIVYHIMQLHGGGVTAMNCPDGGAAFTLRLPSRASEAQERKAA